jgi:hypothetical protein
VILIALFSLFKQATFWIGVILSLRSGKENVHLVRDLFLGLLYGGHRYVSPHSGLQQLPYDHLCLLDWQPVAESNRSLGVLHSVSNSVA